MVSQNAYTAAANDLQLHAGLPGAWAPQSQVKADSSYVPLVTWQTLRNSVLLIMAGMLATTVALRLIAHINQFTFVWPVTGVLMVLVLPRWKGPLPARVLMLLAAATGVLLGGVAVGMPSWLALQTSALTTVDLCLTVCMLLPAVSTFAELKRRPGVLRFALTAVLAPLCTALMGASSLAPFLHETVTRTGIAAFFGNSLGIALTYPLGLFLCTTKRGSLRAVLLRWEALLAIGFFTVVATAAFWQKTGPFLFIVFPPMIVVLLVLGLEGAMVVTLLLSWIGWTATLHGHGPICLMGNATPEYRLLILQIFIWTCLATAMPVGALLDERREAWHKAGDARAIYQTMLHNAEEMIVLSTMDSSQRYVSPAVERITGWTPEEYLAMDRLQSFHPDDRDMAVTMLESLKAGKWEHTLRCRMLQKRGGYKWVEAKVRAYGNEAEGIVTGYVGAVRDISVQHEHEREWAEERAALTREQNRLTNLASTDALTGLPNRRAFEELLCQHEFDLCKQAEQVLLCNGAYTVGLRPLTVMMVDVDYFKLYNDTYGHPAGDSCLRQLADVLRANLTRRDDVVARLGGEEFAIVLPGAGQEAAMRVAERLLTAVRTANRIHSSSPLGHVTVSIGVAIAAPGIGFSYALLLQQADRALYMCKAQGKNCAALSPYHL